MHVLNPGEREYLSPNLIGLQNIAQTFLPQSMNLLNIIDAYREIVNGVRYDIQLNALDTQNKDAEKICHLIVLEKPWLRTHWGDKVRELTYSNCTEDGAVAVQGKDQTDQYESNQLFNGGKRNELSQQDMDKLNSEILIETTTTTTTTETAVTSAQNGDEEAFTALPELSDDEKKWLDGFLLAGAKNFENTRRQNQENEENEPDYHHQESNALKRATSDVIQLQDEETQNQEWAQEVISHQEHEQEQVNES